MNKSGEHPSSASLLRNQQHLQKLWHQKWVVADLGRSFAVHWIIHAALLSAWKVFYFWSASANWASLDVIWQDCSPRQHSWRVRCAFSNEKLCKTSIFKNRKTNKLKAVGWLRGKERSLIWQIKHHSPERISVFQPKAVVFLLIRLISKSVNNSLFFLKSCFF